jgi:hypothetical protein
MAFLTLFWAALVILVSAAGPLKSAIDKAFAKGKTPVPLRGASSRITALPSAQGVPITDIGRQREKTAPIAPPPSVTEVTTSLLDNK